jgi:hypothetical protein
MAPRGKAVLLLLLCIAIVTVGAAYQFFIGFPTTFEGRWVHRVTGWSESSRFEREKVYYAYKDATGNEVKHGPFQRFEEGHLVQQALYRDGKVDGAIVYWNLLGAKTEEVYYHNGTPYGTAFFAQGKLFKLIQQVTQNGRAVGVKTFDNDRYALEFNCGELINAVIDPISGEISPIANASHRACAKP